MSRPSWDAHFLALARTWASMATCQRLQVGCVLVMEVDEHGAPERVQLASGFNGAARGEPHCLEVGCQLEECLCAAGEGWHQHCARAEHAERNALYAAARLGHGVKGATCYVTAYPCWACFRALHQAGVRRVVYATAYHPDPRVAELAQRHGIPLVHLPLESTAGARHEAPEHLCRWLQQVGRAASPEAVEGWSKEQQNEALAWALEVSRGDATQPHPREPTHVSALPYLVERDRLADALLSAGKVLTPGILATWSTWQRVQAWAWAQEVRPRATGAKCPTGAPLHVAMLADARSFGKR